MRKPLTNLLIKPAGPDCNIGCRYCFYLSTSRFYPETAVHRMSDDVLAMTVRQLLAQNEDQLSFSWQGGEPTLMGLPFYERAVEHEMRYGRGQAVSNALQTNGIKLDRDWAAFLTKYHFLVGLSLDGPEHVHDQYRVNLGGNGTWQTVDDRARMLLDAGVSVNALSVVTEYSATHPQEIYAYLKATGLAYMQFIPCCDRDPNSPTGFAAHSVSPAAYGQFLCEIFDLWLADFVDGRPTTSVRFFESLLYLYANVAPNDCTLLEECGTYLVVEHTGDVYSCDFYVTPERRLGNVMENGLEQMLNGEQQKTFGLAKSNLAPACRSCRWLSYCRGGCPKDRVIDESGTGVSYFCESFKTFLSHADGTFRTLAARWENGWEPPAAG